ncbi:sensor histidine kinase [Desulfobacter vibrioformis]|uniref:sensor histidine kinase n=1 Tax=Desulfobacter vibrioformis TaxID=34031 RepID=UPI0005505EBA|nr:PAS domain-containing sensor histidine kinase [Desulfobacter vibrioformis]
MVLETNNTEKKADSTGPGTKLLKGEFLNYQRIWLISFVLTAAFAIMPVIFFAVLDYNLTRRSLENDAEARASRLASNTWRSLSFFLDERKNALSYVVRFNSFEQLGNTQQLANILDFLHQSFGGFTDIGIIDATGVQRAYAGPHGLAGKNYKDQQWFKDTISHGTSVSDVFLGFRNVPHISIALRHMAPDNTYFIIRATIEHQLPKILSEVKTSGNGDAFLINAKGVLQTPSHYFGDVLEKTNIALPPAMAQTRTMTITLENGQDMIAAFRHIPNTSFILVVLKSKQVIMSPWHDSQVALIKYLGISISVILLWIWAVTGYFVRRLKILDRNRHKYFHMAEYENKMASIGRLAAGVAHEINNPLAIINEKAGLIKDMVYFKQELKRDPRLLEIVDVILASVKRCSRITRQLLSFGRQTQTVPVPLTLKTVLDEVLVFLVKEAQLKNIFIDIDVPDTLPQVIGNPGKLQQIFLNIINNAFAAMPRDGRLSISAQKTDEPFVRLNISDSGCGIPPENLNHIFEPFFSTKTNQGGTGLGLSITYGLVQELGGRIEAKSKINEGTTFIIYLPTTTTQKEG